MSSRNGIFIVIMLIALILILAATPLGSVLWHAIVTGVESMAYFIWSLKPK